ncbi:hypothetical protein ABIF26_008974 [Bradyrhizobium elkanii]
MIWKTEALDHRGQHQPGAIHGIGKSQIERQVVGAGAAFVRGEHHEGLRGSRAREAVVEAEFGDGRARAANVSGRGVDEKILAGAVEPGGLRNRSGREKRLPGELVDFGASFAPRVRHDDRNIVAGMAHETVDQETVVDRFRDLPFDRRHHARRWFRVAPNGANVSLDDRNGEFHEHPSDRSAAPSPRRSLRRGATARSFAKRTSCGATGSLRKFLAELWPLRHRVSIRAIDASGITRDARWGYHPPYEARLRKIGRPRLLE